MRIVIAEDERDTLMTLGIFLRSEGFDVVLTQTAQAVKAVREFQPDVVLLDIGMPDRSGYVLASQLTREHGERCPALVAVTTHRREADLRLAEASGVRHHVNQPYESDALLKLLASLKPGG